MACAVAVRLELDTSLVDALGCAALLHHARAQRDVRRRPFEIDHAVFPHPVSTILQTMDERWDGTGPRGLHARRIHVGARILAAVSSWMVWSSADDGDPNPREVIGVICDCGFIWRVAETFQSQIDAIPTSIRFTEKSVTSLFELDDAAFAKSDRRNWRGSNVLPIYPNGYANHVHSNDYLEFARFKVRRFLR